MKLRITASHIRFRITEQEAAQLRQERILTETLYLPQAAPLNYSVKISDAIQNIQFNVVDQTLVLTVSTQQLEKLSHDSSKEGLTESYTENGKNIFFSLAIELPNTACHSREVGNPAKIEPIACE